MKYVFISPHIGFLRHFDRAVRLLCDRGNEIILVFGIDPESKFSDRSVKILQEEYPLVEITNAMERMDAWNTVLSVTREMRNFRIYLKPEHPSPQIGIRRRERFPKIFRPFARSNIGEKLFRSRFVGKLLSWIENIAPPDRTISDWLVDVQADAVIAVTNITSNAPYTDYVKAANCLNIPSIISIASWDNLTTKGTFQVTPEIIFLWNNDLIKEAVDIHGMSQDKIVETGAPTFDYWFESKPTTDRKSFYRNVGMEYSTRYIVYLCSSRSISGDETGFVQQLSDRLVQNPDTSDLILLIRPHPLGGSDWANFTSRNSIVWPANGDVPDIEDAKQNYFDTLYFADAVIGVNTSAMVEAAIVDKPCITIITEQYRSTQTGRGHFYHLLNAGYMEEAYNFNEAVAIISTICTGVDKKSENRIAFVNSFIRPNGLNKNVSELFADAIESAANRNSISALKTQIFNKEVAKPN